ncbi:hypothetical protein V1478_010314 [Vespula squamosa]|uniref:Uncharacterized protein n=1 Tax=Vespula squamosa TaxID=30214 RepID=A0ABD2AHF1_VESSQ
MEACPVTTTLGVRLSVGRYEDAGNNIKSFANGLEFPIKLDNYDGKEPLKEFSAYFECREG